MSSKSNLIVILVFVLASLVFFLYQSYSLVKESQQHSKILFIEHENKHKLLLTMYNSARERLVILLAMGATTDVFELNDMKGHLSFHASNFMKARNELRKRNPTAKEQKLLDEQWLSAKKFAPILMEVADLFIEEKRELATSKLFDEAILGQNVVLKDIDKLLVNSQKNMDLVLVKMDFANEQSRKNLLIISLIIIFISVLFMIFLMTHITKREKEQLDILLEQQQKTANELAYYAMHDVLTGLPNRRYLEDYIERLLASAERKEKKVAFFYMDLDGFKTVNDKFGHEMGDLVLKDISNSFQELIRKGELVARIGGDEFCLVVDEFWNKEDLEKTALRIIEDVKREIMINGQTIQVGVSIGISLYPENGKRYKELSTESDRAMYEIKKAKKGGFAFA